MIYRMKQNAAGLANICILSTMVLVMLSTTVSLYLGMEDALHTRFPKGFEITSDHIAKDDSAALQAKVDGILKDSGVTAKNDAHYRYLSMTMSRSDSHFSLISERVSGNAEGTSVFFIPLDDYNALQGTDVTLTQGQLLLYTPNTAYSDGTASFGTATYKVKEKLASLNVDEDFMLSVNYRFYFIVPDEQSVKDIYDILTAGKGNWQGLSYYDGFDAGLDEQGEIALSKKLGEAFKDNKSGGGAPVYLASAAENKFMFLSLYGGLFFLGIFLGVLFIMATVIIMYYKQMSEGYDDKKRFEIMQKVGLSRDEIKGTIRSQVLTVFFLPLAAAGIHVVAAFKMITKLLYVLNLTNVRLFAECTLGTFALFAVVYAVVYALTAKTYYRIVS
jgi:putative ABC transport system permease protein